MKQKILIRLGKKIRRNIQSLQYIFSSQRQFFLFFFRKIWIPLKICIGVGGIRPSPAPLEVLYHSEHIVVINKPAGVLTHPSRHNEPDTLLNRLLYFLKTKHIAYDGIPGPISRLDRNTSGIVLFAISLDAKRDLGICMMKKGFQKKYIALVEGKTPSKQDIRSPLCRESKIFPKQERHFLSYWIDAFFPSKKVKYSKMMVHESGKESHTAFTLKEYFPLKNCSLLEVEIFTGRMHQIRIHVSSEGYPIVGDSVYAKEREDLPSLPRVFLHAHSLAFTSPLLGSFTFTSPLPQDLESYLTLLQ